MVSFTGSTVAGRKILAQAAATVKRVSLELGGKSAQIYLPDAVHRAAMGAAMVVMSTAGQACVAATRMLVPEDQREQVLEAVGGAYRSIKVGPPTSAEATMGPVISAAQRDRCERLVAAAEEHGGKVVCGGGRPEGLDRGYYFEPTVLDIPDNANPAAQEEIFGPVIAVLGYRDLDHAVAIANDTIYGLSGQVYGADVAAAVGVARRLRTGAVNVNTTVFSAYAPSGGYKQSGLGRERGPDGIREFQEVKHMSIGELAEMSITDVQERRRDETDGAAIDLNWLISVDDHILEPPNLWVDRVASKDRDRAPHMEADDNGMDMWVYDGKRYPNSG